MIYLFIFILILGLTTPVEAKEADGGELVAPFKMGMGARATGMGRAFVALADDSSVVYWNPSGLGRLNGSEVNFSCFQPHDSIDGISYYTVSYGHSFSPYLPGALGLGIAYLNTDVDEKINVNQQIAFFSYGYQLNEVISIGTTLKRVDYHLVEYDDDSYGGDLGLSFSPREGIKVAMLLQDLWGAEIRPVETKERFPFRIRSGLSYSWKELTYNINKMTFSLGVDYQFKDKLLDWGAGIEGEILEMMCLRCGYYEPAEEINLGAGIIISGWRLDYGFGLPAASELGPSHRLSLGRKFGQVE